MTLFTYGFTQADTATAFAVFGWFWLVVALLAVGVLVWRQPLLRPWLPAFLGVAAVFVGLRALCYSSTLFGADQPDWLSFYGAYLNDPTAHPSLVLFTTKLGIAVAARLAEAGLQGLGIPQVSPAFMVSGRFSGIGFDLGIGIAICILAWRMAPAHGRPLLILALGLAQAMVPAHLYMATTISYNLIGDFCLLLVLFADLAAYRAVCDILEGLRRDERLAPEEWFRLLLRSGLSVAAFGGAMTLLLGAKWLIPPVAAIFAAQVGFALVVGCRPPLPRRQLSLILLTIVWVFGSMLMFTAGTYFMATAPKIIGSGEHFSNNFAFFAQAISVEPITEIGTRIKVLLFDLMAPNVGLPTVLLVPLGFLGVLVQAWRRRDSALLLINLWAAVVLAQSVVSNYTTMTSVFSAAGVAAMTRNTLLMSVLQLYAVLACFQLAAVAAAKARMAVMAGLAAVLLADVGFSGVGFASFARSDRPYIRLAEFVSARPVGAAIATIEGPDSWCLPLKTLVKPGPRYILMPNGPDAVDGERPDHLITSSCDGLWSGGAAFEAQVADRVRAAGYVSLARYEAGPALFRTRLGALLTGGRFFGLFQPAWIEVWQRGPLSLGRK